MHQKNASYWRNLDNAAKMFSAASSSKDTKVFRFYCVLKEPVAEETLQEALDLTVKKYPVFLSVMRKGLFWHYLEKSDLHPVVREEYKEPCSCLYIRDKKNLLFEVTYYKNRINFEVFHALTDGTGATLFLQELVKNYLYLAHGEDGLEEVELTDKKVTVQDQESDSFSKYYDPDRKRKREKKIHAYQIKKLHKEYEHLRVQEATASAKELLAVSRQHGVSMTVLLTAALIWAIHKEMNKLQESKPVVIMVPVNLRKIFPSNSMLNFFGYIEPGYQFGKKEDTFETVLADVKLYFDENLTQEEVANRMNQLIAIEKHKILKWAPLELKNPCIRVGAKMAEKEVTAVLSNMGVVKMPGDYAGYIKRFGVFTSTVRTELCICSFQDTVSFGFTSRYENSNIQRNFYQLLESLGVKITREEPEFPEDAIPNYKGKEKYKSFSFGCLSAGVLTMLANKIFDPGRGWGILAAAGIFSMWFALTVGYVKRYNLMKNAMWQLLLVTLGSVLWDLSTGWRAWSVSYVFPGVVILILISMIAITRIQSYSPREYMIYEIMACVYGIIFSVLFLSKKMVTNPVPSMVCMGFSFLFLCGLFLFKGKEFKEELYKKFHV